MASSDLTQKCSEGNKGTSEPNLRSRWFVFTWFHDTPIELDETMVYLAYGDEVCPSTGRRHLQGWVYFKNPRYTYSVRKQYKCYMKKMMGNLQQNDDYCSKAATLQHFGTRPSQGERNDLKTTIEELKTGVTTIDELVLDAPHMFHQYGRTLERAMDVINRSKTRDWVTRGIWIYGPTGCGKSRWVYDNFTNIYSKPSDGRWWDAYTGQDTVLLDDFRGDVAYGELLRLVDRYPMTVPRRGREPHTFLARTVIITSSLPPSEVYHNLAERDSLDQLFRRFEVVDMSLNTPNII